MKIRDVLACIGPRDIPCIDYESHIDEVIGIMAHFPHTRLVYAVDADKRLRGTISVGSLLRHIYPHHYEGTIHAHGILGQITAETAQHLMDKKSIAAYPDEAVDEVLERMACARVKEMAVLDNEGRIMGDITAVDLLRYSYLERQGKKGCEGER
ncbi:MAG: CBS domain-containing protein [Thermodesulfobacteriota bacterium]